MKQLQLSTRLNDVEVNKLKGPLGFLGWQHYTDLVHGENTTVLGPDGDILGMLLKNVIPEKMQERALPALLTLRGDLTNRSMVVYAGSQMPGIRVDGTLSSRKGVPKIVTAAHGGKGDVLGYLEEKGGRNCRETGWTRKRPDVLKACMPMIELVDMLYRAALPEHYQRQMKWVNATPDSLKLKGTAFTSVTVNLNNRCAAHTDKGDVHEGMGCLTTHGDFVGGALILPKFKVAFDYAPGDLLLVNVHEVHANAPFEGQRVSCVYYAREKMHRCVVAGAEPVPADLANAA